MARLQSEKKDLTAKLLAGENVRDKISALDAQIRDAQQKIDTLVTI